MADDEQFSLCWNNFNSNLSAGFHESLCRGDLVDVTLAAEGQFVKAHRLVLSVCSPYFRKMFTQMPANQHAFVFLKDVSHSALKDLIQFMYCGEVNVKQDALPAFISTAEALQIKGLTDGEPAPSQSPAKPSTPAPQQTIPAPSMTATSPRVRTQRSSTTRTYKLESEDSGDDKPQQIVLQTQNQQQQIVQQQQQTQKRPAQRSITPHTMPTVKRVKNSDPLEATDPTQITVQTVSDNKSSGDAEFIDLPIDLPTKSEPDYAEDAGEVETAEQEATYVEDDSYGDMKYDESYFTENDETGAATAAATTSGTTTVKTQGGTFSESYVSDTGDQSATEAQAKRNLNQIFNASTQYPPIIQDVNRGGITFDGYIFHRNTVIKKGAVYYRCSKSRTLRCPATLIVYADGSAKPNKKPHNHARKKPKELQFAENRDGSPQSAPQYPPSIIQDVRRGGIALDGYHFQRRVIKEGVNYYRCSQSRTLRCPANLNVYADGSVKPNKKSHNHGRKPVNEFAGKKLWFKGYSFCKDTKNGIRNKMQWKCTNKSCSVRLNTDISGNVVFIRGVHAHAAPIFPSIFVMKFSRIIEIKKNKSTK